MPAAKRIQAVTFDAAGTLMRVAEPVGETYARIARGVGAKLSPQALDAGFRAAFAHMRPMAFSEADAAARLRCERDWWRTLVERVVRHAGQIQAFDAYFDTLFAYYASGAAWRAYPEARAALAAARARGLRVAVVSNFDSRLPPILRELGFEALLDSVVYSTGCGAAKPDPRIFLKALGDLAVEPRRALHVGDSLAADYHGATAAGLRALHLQRRPGPAPAGIPTIRRLDELATHYG